MNDLCLPRMIDEQDPSKLQARVPLGLRLWALRWLLCCLRHYLLDLLVAHIIGTVPAGQLVGFTNRVKVPRDAYLFYFKCFARGLFTG